MLSSSWCYFLMFHRSYDRQQQRSALLKAPRDLFYFCARVKTSLYTRNVPFAYASQPFAYSARPDCGGSSNKRLDEKAEQEATGFLLDLVSVSGDNGLKLPRGIVTFCRSLFCKLAIHPVVGRFQLNHSRI